MATIKKRIASLRRLEQELLGEYAALMEPWGMGYTMPENISKKGVEIMDHVFGIQEKYKCLERSIGIVHTRPIPNTKVKATVVDISDIQDKGLGWAINRICETIKVPKRLLKAECVLRSVEFLEQVEKDQKLAQKIADDRRYVSWFENRYRIALIYTYRAMTTMPVKGTLMDFYNACTKGYMNQPRFKNEYKLFKDENFGGEVSEPISK